MEEESQPNLVKVSVQDVVQPDLNYIMGTINTHHGTLILLAQSYNSDEHGWTIRCGVYPFPEPKFVKVGYIWEVLEAVPRESVLFKDKALVDARLVELAREYDWGPTYNCSSTNQDF